MDTVSDLITRLRNGSQRKKLSVRVRKSKHAVDILECLYNEGYIRGYKIEECEVEVYLKYKDGWSVIKELKRVSKPSKRVYYSKRSLSTANLRNECLVYSSTEGVKINVGSIKNGGEVLFSIS